MASAVRGLSRVGSRALLSRAGSGAMPPRPPPAVEVGRKEDSKKMCLFCSALMSRAGCGALPPQLPPAVEVSFVTRSVLQRDGSMDLFSPLCQSVSLLISKSLRGQRHPTAAPAGC